MIYKNDKVKFIDTWETDNYGKIYAKVTSLLPVSILKKFREYDRTNSPLLDRIGIEELRNSLLTEGIKDQLILFYNPRNGYARLGEGCHRLMIAEQEGVTYLPVRILRDLYLEPDLLGKRGGAFIKNPKILSKTYKRHINSDLKPSDVFDINDFYEANQFVKFVKQQHCKLVSLNKLEVANKFLKFVISGDRVSFRYDDFRNELKELIKQTHWLFRDYVNWDYQNHYDIYWRIKKQK